MSQLFEQVIDLLYLAKQNGVDIALKEDQLQLKLPRNRSIDRDLIEQLKANKQLIIDFLRDHQPSSNRATTITKVDREPTQQIPLSFSQERLWFIHQMEGSIQYHIPAVLRLRGEINPKALENALRHILERHEVLRTVFVEEEGNTYQVIRDAQDWQLEFIDGSPFSKDEKTLQEFVQQLVIVPFDLSRDYMVRAHLVGVNEQEHVLVLVTHHIASDGWSASIMVKELIELYSAFSEGRDPVLTPLAIQYADYAVWQRHYLQGDILTKKIEYWKHRLAGVSPLQLPSDYKRPPIWSANGSSRPFNLDKRLSDHLVALSQGQGATLYMTLLAAFNILLYKYSGQQDICVGSPIANRTRQEIESLMGFFINTLALRTEVNGEASFRQLLQQVKATTVEAYEHQDVPFEKVVEVVVKERDLSRNPLFQVMFALQNMPDTPHLRLGDIELSPMKLPHTATKFDITFLLVETPHGIRGDMQFATDLYNEQTIIRMMEHYRHLLYSIVASPDEKVDALSILPDDEKQILLVDFNNTQVDYPEGSNIIRLFEEQAALTPGATAIIYEDAQLTYQALNERANQVAHYLAGTGVSKETLVAVCIGRSIEMVIGILGVLKSGAAYVPIDPEYPHERISYMVEDSMSSIVLTSKAASSKIQAPEGIEILELDQNSLINRQSRHNINTEIDPTQLAYVIYTSGSTGKPKGVMIEHQNVCSFIFWSRDEFSSSRFDIGYASTSICFDLSVFEIFYPLSIGKKIRILENGMQIEKYLPNDSRVLVNTVPVVIENVLNERIDLANVTMLNMAGEPVPSSVLQRLDTDRIEVRNLYGPTEVTTYSTVYRMRKDKPVLIGKPISNTRIHILDQKKQLVPIGVPGEICISGSGVARGYLNRPELSAEKFIHDSFSGDLTSRVYTTGDLGRWLPDGNIEYLGRIDQQVKVRGYRIEPGEIETAIQEGDLVQQAAVVAKKHPGGSNQLVAYVIPKGDFNKETLITYLKGRLPEYMIPASWVPLERFPLTPNGKIDKRALPDPDRNELTHYYVAPRNDAEYTLSKIWQDVLSLPRVGITDNFFEIGGHSLLAMRLISFIRKELNVDFSIKELFTYPTIEGLAARMGSGSNEVTMAPLVAYGKKENIPLSFSQERLWFIDQLEGSVQYHIPAVLRLNGKLDVSALNHAFKTVLDRHEVLRSMIYQVDGDPFIRVKEDSDLAISLIDEFSNKEQKSNNELRQYISRLINEPFDLSVDNMLRASLIRLAGEEHILVVTMHHIASDGWSISILVREVVELYEAFIQRRRPSLIPLPIQYTDYAIWQKNYLQGDILDRKLEYWKNKLSGVSPIPLPTDRARPAVRSNQGAMHGFTIDKNLADRLQQLSQQNGVTLFMTLMGAFNVLMHRYSDQEDICVGTPIAGRQHEQLENLIGFFINTLALRTKVNRDGSFLELLSEVRRTTLDAYEHQEVPFEKIVEAVVRERDMSITPVFQVMFVLQNTPPVPALRLGEVKLTPVENPQMTTQFDLSFIIMETSNGLQGSVNYSTDLYDGITIERMISHFQHLLSAITIRPQQAVGLLPMLSKQEETQLLYGFNNTTVDYPANKTIVDLFEEQVSATPDNIALIFEKEVLTYSALNEKANQLAHYLRAKGAGEGALVAICMRRSPDMIIGLLGVLKAGFAYVPIDPDYPQERKVYILQDSGASLVISDSSDMGKALESERIGIVELKGNVSISDQPTTNIEIQRLPHHLAYVIYTSGSTGKPKGVMIEHCNVYSFICWSKDEFSNSNFDIVYASTSICFDLSIFEIFYPLSVGKKIRLLENGMEIEKFLDNDRLILANTVPVVVDNLLNSGADFQNISVLNMAGEPVPASVLHRLDTERMEVRNLYGPTEDTTYSTVFRLRKQAPVLIGKPISNTRVYIVDKKNELVPIGVAGEICLAGEGVTRGYLNRPELTAEKFVNDFYNTDATSKIYKTGDLGRWLSDGNIEYLGRIDQQVKVRGYRIEPGEIETVLQQNELVKQVAVLAKKDSSGNHRLVAYIVPKNGFDKQSLITYLEGKLPQYMVPASWAPLETLPLTPNGKIDKKALPNPVDEGTTKEYLAPGNETEQSLARIWSQLLSLDRVGISDNFFEVGGHSLIAMRLISSIRKELNAEITIKELFAYPTIRGLAARLIALNHDITMPPIQSGRRPAFVPLSFSQERLWFIDRLEGTVHYHMPAGLRLKGNVNFEALNYAFQQIVNRHEVLRTVIRDQDGEPFQFVLPTNGFNTELVDGSAYELHQLQRKINDLISKPFDLSKDHMIRASLIRLKEQEHVLAITMHHIAADGWSIPIVIKELVELYNAYVQGRTFRLPALQVQYADYAIWQRENLVGDVLDRKLEYWKHSLSKLTPLQLPLDFPRPPIQSTRGAVRKIIIDKKISSALDELAKRQESTSFMTLLAAFNVLLYRYSGQQSICVGTPIAGRQQQELEDLIGFFVNTLALRIDITGNESFINVLGRVKETVLTGYTYQDVPFEKVVEAVVKERDMARSPVFQVMFILQNAASDPAQELGDVQLSYEALRHTTSKFDITLSLTRTGAGFVGAVEYCVDLFTEATVDRMMQHFQNLLVSIVKDPRQQVGVLSMLSPQEELQLIRNYNTTSVDYSKKKTIVNLFEEQVELTPDSPAVIFKNEKLSYRQLNTKANQLAYYLVSKGVRQEGLVPLCAERSIEMIISVLAILKTGAAYVPIDPEYPQELINFKLNDTKAGFIIVGGKIAPGIKSDLSVEVFDIDSDWAAITDQPTTNLDLAIKPQSLVYVIYTSGSTGKPKGVQMAHTGMVNLLLWQEKQFRNKNRRVLQFASLNFDVSFQEIFSTLSFGSSLYLISEENRRDPSKMIRQLKAHGITHLFLPYIVLKNLAEYVVATGQVALQLEEIITAGEQLKVTDDIRILLAKGNIELVNQYGPTEAHVVSSYRLDKASISTLPPIGKPIDNTQLHILNESKAVVPVGIAGELCIGGVQVARGYLNRPELTEEKFVVDPFSLEKGVRMYRTGDLARWLPDGNIEYLGRIDDQVKIRGYRVEVGEIENILQEYHGVRQAVVKSWEDLSGQKQLIAYVVPEGIFHLDAMKAFLKLRVPSYMLPAQWVKMASLPVTGNGKVDRKALPLPDTTPPVHAYMPPTNDTEEKLLGIWQKLLGVHHIGVKNNFFEVGGHSLLAMRLIASIRRQMGVDLPLLDIYESDIQSLAAKIISLQKKEAIDSLSWTVDSGTSEDLTAALEMVHRMEKGIVEWGANGHSKYLVPIKKGGTKNPFFGIISFKQYRVLASLMPDDQPLFYLPPTRSASVEEIAAHYIKEMKLSHPSGPYTIGGFCGAGMIAMEIAEQLKTQDDEVSAVILFEYYAPESMIRKKSFAYKKRLFARYKRRLIAKKKSGYSRLSLFKFVAKKVYKQLRDLLDPPPPKFITSPEYSRYRHKPYSGRVILFQASVPPLEATDSPMMGWSKYFSGDVKVVTIPGGHLGIFREPEIRKLAEELTAVLEDLNNKSD